MNPTFFLEIYLSTVIIVKITLIIQVSDIDQGMNRHRAESVNTRERNLSQVYNRYVQPLYKYGMQVCGETDLVLNIIQQLFVRLKSEDELLISARTLRFCLFKRFRDLLFSNIPFIRSSVAARGFAHRPAVVDSQHPEPELSRAQREAAFLKLYCEFSFQEIATLMNLDPESCYTLVTRAIETIREDGRKQISQTVCEIGQN
jgi:RNA polymerase sigma-70 factor (ECF subfamily)